MSKFSLEQLTEGIRQRHLGAQNRQLVEKWTRTGLLRGLEGQNREVMSTLLENQAAQVLREQSSLGNGAGAMVDSGDMSGFQNVAFPIVRRVFGGLVANELVSIQPMSLPSGLLFYLDYTYGTVNGVGVGAGATYNTGSSIYGSPVGKGISSGALGVGGMYDLAGTGYSRVYAKRALTTSTGAENVVASGSYGKGTSLTAMDGTAGTQSLHATGTDGKLLLFDPQITSEIEEIASGFSGCSSTKASYNAYFIRASALSSSNQVVDTSLIKNVGLFKSADASPSAGLRVIKSEIQDGKGLLNVRRLNEIGTFSAGQFTSDPLADITKKTTVIKLIVSGTTAGKANCFSLASLKIS